MLRKSPGSELWIPFVGLVKEQVRAAHRARPAGGRRHRRRGGSATAVAKGRAGIRVSYGSRRPAFRWIRAFVRMSGGKVDRERRRARLGGEIPLGDGVSQMPKDAVDSSGIGNEGP